MNRSKSKILSIILLIALMITGCAEPDMAEEAKNLMPTEPVVARILLPNEGPQTRTILPGKLGQADHYTLTFTKIGDTQVTLPEIQNMKPVGNYLEITGLEIGSYSVHVDGFYAAGEKIYTGDSSENLVIEDLENVTEITIDLYPTFGPGTTGRIQMTFDWSTLIGSENSISIGNKQEKEGPLTRAIQDGTLKFVIYTGEIGQKMVKRGEPIVWNSATAESQTSMTCVFEGIPTGKKIAACFSILDKDDTVIVDRKYNITAQVYTDQTSYWDGLETQVIYLKSNLDKWYSNVSSINIEYPAENYDTSFIITWDARTAYDKSPIFRKIFIDVGVIGEPTSIHAEFVPELGKPNEVTITGLEKGKQYYIETRTESLGGESSNTIRWTKEDGSGFITKVNVSSITFDDIEAKNLTTGQNFPITATVEPIDATYTDLTWESTEKDVLIITNTTGLDNSVNVIANKPGITNIKVTNNDPRAPFSAVRTGEIKVTLAQPDNIVADFNRDAYGQSHGINISWSPVEFAEEYELFRKTGAGSYAHLADVKADSFGVVESSYVDHDIKSGESYTYKVVAKAPSIDSKFPGFSATSTESAESNAITMEKPKLILSPVSIKDNKFTIVDISKPDSVIAKPKTDPLTGEINMIPVITLDLGETKTLKIEKELLPGATYTWYLNGFGDYTPEGEIILPNRHIIKTGSYAEASTIEFNGLLDGIDRGNDGLQEITLVAETDSDMFSAYFQFSVIAVPVESVVFADDPANPDNMFSTKDKTFKLSASTNPSDPTIPEVMYRFAANQDESIADINGDTGEVTMLKPGTVTFEAFALGDPTKIATKTVTIYTPTVESAKGLINAVNTELRTHIIEADTKFGHDWFPPKHAIQGQTQHNYDGKDSFSTGTINIKSSIGGGGYTNEKSEPGSVTFSNYKLADGTVINGTLRLLSNNPGSYLDVDNLQFVGYGNYENTLTVTLPNTQGTATIKYNNIDITVNNKGSYDVTFQYELQGKTSGVIDKTHKYSNEGIADIVKPFN